MGEKTFENYSSKRRNHWENLTSHNKGSNPFPGRHYRACLTHLYSQIIPPGLRVLEVGCGTGDLLAALRPARGVGVDFAATALSYARQRHPEQEFIDADAHFLTIGETFDYILLSDLVNDLWDVQEVFERLRPLCHSGSRLIVNTYSRLWQWPLQLARTFRLAQPLLPQNWLTPQDLDDMLELAGFEVVTKRQELICPLPCPLLSPLANRWLARIWPFNHLALVSLLVARPRPAPIQPDPPKPTVTVLVPARNEAGNIADIFTRVPEMGGGTELIFVEGNSTDDTYATIEREIQKRPGLRVQLYKQPGRGKGDAVRYGFSQAHGDILMILDADLTVPPESLPRFYEALTRGTGEFINGVRLVYPMEDRAMQFCNLAANKLFGLTFSWLLGQPIKDTLCGTKALWRRDYAQIAATRAYFGDFDPFGDFDLLFGAARLNRKILDLPVRYGERTYGSTNIQRWRHGWLLLRMVTFAACKLKFV